MKKIITATLLILSTSLNTQASEKFTVHESFLGFKTCSLDLTKQSCFPISISNIYSQTNLDIPLTVPSLHSYNSNSYRLAAIDIPFQESIKLLPNSIVKLLGTKNPGIEKLFLSIEKADDETLSFRPHKFVDPLAPQFNSNMLLEGKGYNYAPTIEARVFDCEGKPLLFSDKQTNEKGEIILKDGKPIDLDTNPTVLYKTCVSIHSSGPSLNLTKEPISPADIVCSPKNMNLPEDKLSPKKTNLAYSVIYYDDQKTSKKTVGAITIHWLLDSKDQMELSNILDSCSTFNKFLEKMTYASCLSKAKEWGIVSKILQPHFQMSDFK